MGLWTTGEQITEARLNQRFPPQRQKLQDVAEDILVPGWSGRFVSSNSMGNTDRILYIPIVVPVDLAATHIGIEVDIASGTGGALARLGIYNAKFTSGELEPDSLLLDAGTVAIDSTGLKEIAITQTLAGWYYLAISTEQSDPKLFGPDMNALGTIPVVSQMSGTIADVNAYLYQDRAAGTGENALPDPAAPDGHISIGLPIVYLRR